MAAAKNKKPPNGDVIPRFGEKRAGRGNERSQEAHRQAHKLEGDFRESRLGPNSAAP
jgi:hypothetical protein